MQIWPRREANSWDEVFLGKDSMLGKVEGRISTTAECK